MLSGFLEVAKMRTGKSERFDLIKQVYDKIDLDHKCAPVHFPPEPLHPSHVPDTSRTSPLCRLVQHEA